MRNFFKKIAKRKLWAGIAALALMVAGYFGYRYFSGGGGETAYVTEAVKRGMITVSVSGSGQVSASNQLDVKSKVSGDAVYVAPVEGREIGASALIIQLDARDAEKAVRDAGVNLESARIALEKLRGPAGAAVPRHKQNAEDDLKKAYDDGFTAVSNAFLDLPAAITGLKEVLFGMHFSGSQSNMNYYADAVKNYDLRSLDYKDSANASYQKARAAYDKNFDDYRVSGREAKRAEIETLIDETYGAAINLSDAVKFANHFIQFYKDRLTERDLKPNSLADTHLSQLDAYTDKTNTHIAALLNIKNQIKNYKDAVSNADLDVKTQELAVRQRENALLDAKEKLSDYFVSEPARPAGGDERIKPSMSVSAAIITDVKSGALIVPNSAVKQEGGASYVEITSWGAAAPRRQNVEVGLSNDSDTEIISGLNDSDAVVTRVVTSGVSETETARQNSSFRIPGLPGQGGGGVRIQR